RERSGVGSARPGAGRSRPSSAPRGFPAGGLARPGGLSRRLRLLRPCREDVVLVRTDGAMLVAVPGLVAVAERHALRGEERAEERAHREDLVADELEQPADLPLGHRAQPEAA